MNIYKNKYIKYKQKYIQLKQKAGSDKDEKVPPDHNSDSSEDDYDFDLSSGPDTDTEDNTDGKAPPRGEKKPYPLDSPPTFFMNDDTDLKSIIDEVKLTQYEFLFDFKTAENLRYKSLDKNFKKFCKENGMKSGHFGRLMDAIDNYIKRDNGRLKIIDIGSKEEDGNIYIMDALDFWCFVMCDNDVKFLQHGVYRKPFCRKFSYILSDLKIDEKNITNITIKQARKVILNSLGHVSFWDVSDVINMSNELAGFGNNFNDDISRWDVSNVTDMGRMFSGCKFFNQDVSSWNVSNVTDMESMFSGCKFFNQPLNNWNVSKVTNMSNMFWGCTNFNQPLNNWVVSSVTNMSRMFSDCTSFNQPLVNWERNGDEKSNIKSSSLHNVTDMSNMFRECKSFNQTLNNWNVSNVTDMSNMFNKCIIFNQTLHNWNTSKVTNFTSMFENCSAFTILPNNWSINTRARDMEDMFSGTQLVENLENFAGAFMSMYTVFEMAL